jgi:hypothetical protein
LVGFGLKFEPIPIYFAESIADDRSIINNESRQGNQQKVIIDRNEYNNDIDYDPHNDFPEPGIGYVFRNPRCSQLIPMSTDEK